MPVQGLEQLVPPEIKTRKIMVNTRFMSSKTEKQQRNRSILPPHFAQGQLLIYTQRLGCCLSLLPNITRRWVPSREAMKMIPAYRQNIQQLLGHGDLMHHQSYRVK